MTSPILKQDVNVSLVASEVDAVLAANGMMDYQRALPHIVRLHEGKTFSNKCSLISNEPIVRRPLEAFIVDCGGTNTRTLRYTSNSAGSEDFSSTPDSVRKNKDWMTKPGLPGTLPIHSYFSGIIQEMIAAAGGEPTHAKNVAMIWSNNGIPYKLSGKTAGVSLLVSGKDDGTDYRKGEPFIEGLKDGNDIGAIFIAEAAAHGVTLESLVIANDTIFVATAAEGSTDAAGVNSSGSNLEAVIGGFLTNLECGARIQADLAATKFESLADKSVESFVAGRWFTQRFVENVLGFCKQCGNDQLSTAFSAHAKSIFSDPDNGAIAFSNLLDVAEKIYGQKYVSQDDVAQFKSALHLPAETELDVRAMYALAGITHHVAERAVKLTAAMCAIALSHRVDTALAEKRSLSLAMDSRVLEGLDRNGWFVKSLFALIGHVDVQLLSERRLADGGCVSVPIQGAARALFQFTPHALAS